MARHEECSEKLAVGVIIVVMLAGLSGCTTVSVSVDYDPDADFSRYATYRWHEKPADLESALSGDPLVEKRVRTAADAVLAEKGFRLIAAGEADLIAVVNAGTTEKMVVNDWGGYGWYSPGWGLFGSRVDVNYYTEGTLIIDMVDAGRNALVWRGMAKGVVRAYDSPREMAADLSRTVSRMLAPFPPGSEHESP